MERPGLIRQVFGIGGAARAPASGSLRGTVRSRESVIAGALVCAASVGYEGTSAPASPCTLSDVGGRYAFARLAPSAYLVNAMAEGWLPGAAASGRPVVLAPSSAADGVDIVLERGGVALQGTVLDATGGPVPHARVRAVRTDAPRVSLDAEADALGRFRFSLQQGFVLVVAEAEGYTPARVPVVAPRSDLELILTPGASIAGLVVAMQEERPVAGVKVHAVPVRRPVSPLFDLLRSASSDENGAFRIDGLEPDAYQLIAIGAAWRGQMADVVELGVAQQLNDVRVWVECAAEVRGRVVDQTSGEPCREGFAGLGAPRSDQPMFTGASKGVPPESFGPEQATAIASDGSVHFEGVPAGNYVVDIKCRDKLLRDGPRFLQVGDKDVAGLTWAVTAGATLHVALVDARNRVLPHTRFVLTWPAQSITVLTSDAEGVFELSGLPPGKYGLGAYDGTVRDPEREVEVVDNSVTKATLVVAGSGAILVEAKSKTGAPIDELFVSARAIMPGPVAQEGPSRRIPAQALGGGQFRIGPVPAGPYVVSAEDGIHSVARVGDTTSSEVRVSDSEITHVEFVLDRGGVIGGSVLTPSGAPAPNVWVTAEGKSAKDGASSPLVGALSGAKRRVLTDLDGRFSLGGLATDQRYTLRAVDPYGPAVVQHDIAPGSDVQLRLLATGSIAGLAIDSEGRPVTEFTLRATNPATGSGLEKTVLDGAGRFSITELAPGSIGLSVANTSGDTGELELDLAPGAQLTDIRVVLERERRNEHAPDLPGEKFQ